MTELFVLIGLRAPRLFADVSGSPTTAIAVAAAIVVVLIAVRMLWMFTVPGLVRAASSAIGSASLVQSPRERVLDRGERDARAEVARAAPSRLEEISAEENLEEQTEERIRAVYEERLDRPRAPSRARRPSRGGGRRSTSGWPRAHHGRALGGASHARGR